MQCMIHQYAKTEKDIIRLEEMINLKTIMEERSPVLDSMKREGRKEGEIIGEKRGRKEGEERGILKVLNDLEKEVDKDIIEKLAKNTDTH